MNRNNSILFAGDPHGDFHALITAVQKYQPKAVVLLGDYDLEKPLEQYLSEILDKTEVWWIAGNHDFQTPKHYQYLFNSNLIHQNLHLKVTEIAGIRIAGLSGIFLGRVWYPPQPPKWLNKQDYLQYRLAHKKQTGLSLKYQSAIWHDEFEALKKLKADILVSHEAPNSHRHGFSVISDLALAMGVKTIFHGHLHENYASMVRRYVRVFGVADKTAGEFIRQ